MHLSVPRGHVTCFVCDGGVRVGRSVVEEVVDTVSDVGDVRYACCSGVGAYRWEHRWVYGSCVVEEGTQEFLDSLSLCWCYWVVCRCGGHLLFGSVFGGCPRVRRVLRFRRGIVFEVFEGVCDVAGDGEGNGVVSVIPL